MNPLETEFYRVAGVDPTRGYHLAQRSGGLTSEWRRLESVGEALHTVLPLFLTTWLQDDGALGEQVRALVTLPPPIQTALRATPFSAASSSMDPSPFPCSSSS